MDYLLKPISLEKFQECISRCRERTEGRTTIVVKEDKSYNSIFIHVNTIRGNYVNIPFNELIFIKSKGNNLLFHRLGNEEEEVYMSFKDLERMLEDKRFKRVHKSYIVNVDFIQAIEYGEIILKSDQQRISLTSGYRKDFFKSLGNQLLKSSR